jgi:circadian clock protein KaiC
MPDPAVASTGIDGLDDILRGGFPRGRLMLIEGDPGVGKTTLALQYLLAGVRQGERALYVTLSETREELQGVADSHGFSLEGLELFELSAPDALTSVEENTLFHPSEVELAETTKAVVNLCSRIEPQRVVLDSLSEIRLLAQSPLRYRREILALKQYFSHRSCTVLLIDDRTSDAGEGHMLSLAHGAISMEQLAPLYGAQRRRLRVLKLRGVDFRGGYHDFALARGGLQVFPRLVASEHHEPFTRETVSSGLAELDDQLGGGVDRGSSLLFLGPSGTGKSALASQFGLAAARRGERVAHYSFDESVTTLLARSAALGIDLERHRQSGLVAVRQIDPAELPPGQFISQIRTEVEQEKAQLVIIDSLNGYLHAMPDESYLVLQLHELLSYLGQRGVLTVLTLTQHGLVGRDMSGPTDVSYLADAVILLRHFEVGGLMRKAISVLKRRTGPHEASIRELQLGPQGIRVGRPLVEFKGVFSGIPDYQGGAEALLGNQRGA